MFLRTSTAAVLTLLIASPVAAQVISVFHNDGEPMARRARDAGQPDLARVETLIVQRTNAFRRKHDRQPVETDPELERTAESFAAFMAKTDKYGHDVDGNQPSERAAAKGYDFCIVSENIAFQFSTAGFETAELARRFVEGWVESPGHRKNMLDADVTETGVAVARSSESGKFYAVQMFGRPQSRQIQFVVANDSEQAVSYTISGKEFSLPPRYTRTHTRCRTPELSFGKGVEVKDRPENEPLTPENGAQFTIVGSSDGPVVVPSTTE